MVIKKSVLCSALLFITLSDQAFAIGPDEDTMKLVRSMSQRVDKCVIDPAIKTVCANYGAILGQSLNQQFLMWITGVKNTNWSSRIDDDFGYLIGGAIGIWIGELIVEEKHKAQAKLGDSFWKLLDAGKGASQGIISYSIPQHLTNSLDDLYPMKASSF